MKDPFQEWLDQQQSFAGLNADAADPGQARRLALEHKDLEGGGTGVTRCPPIEWFTGHPDAGAPHDDPAPDLVGLPPRDLPDFDHH